ncbi:MAG: hypothetical protein OEZ48_15040 [Candidatus Bathyarchaeota archaeon]|nr:hypothetical protein [Candidatus Bathyarchaeota archaeon]
MDKYAKALTILAAICILSWTIALTTPLRNIASGVFGLAALIGWQIEERRSKRNLKISNE